jgi:hypothetical protein
VAWKEVSPFLIVRSRKAVMLATLPLDLADCCLRDLAAAEVILRALCAAASASEFQSILEMKGEALVAAG